MKGQTNRIFFCNPDELLKAGESVVSDRKCSVVATCFVVTVNWCMSVVDKIAACHSDESPMG